MNKDRLSVKDINTNSHITEILHVQDKLVQERIDNGMSPQQAAKRTNEEIRQRTGTDHKQFKVRRGY